jgi:hypothetical protein
MPDAARILIVALSAAALAACNKDQSENSAGNQDMGIEGNLAGGQLPPDAEIETLPPDESSVTSSNELQSGADQADVNLSNTH